MIIFSALIRKNKIQNFIYYYFKLKYKSCFLSAFNELFITKKHADVVSSTAKIIRAKPEYVE